MTKVNKIQKRSSGNFQKNSQSTVENSRADEVRQIVKYLESDLRHPDIFLTPDHLFALEDLIDKTGDRNSIDSITECFIDYVSIHATQSENELNPFFVDVIRSVFKLYKAICIDGRNIIY